MPEALEKELLAKAKAKGFSEERTGAYVYGTMRKTGWVPSTQKKKKKKRKVGHLGSVSMSDIKKISKS